MSSPTALRRTVLALVGPEAVGPLGEAAGSVGLEVEAVASLVDLLASLREASWVATVVSLDGYGIDEALARRIAEQGSSGVLLLSASGASLERALLAERVGAAALLREPLRPQGVRPHLEAVADEGPEVPVPPPGDPAQDSRMVGSGPALARLFETVARVAPTGATVLLSGESGTGKELVARAIHDVSDRRGPFVAVNCAAIPEQLLESELFGHERGAFTGAVARKSGRFERAHGGTLFLDEIGDMSLVLQAKILRALEDRTIERVGGEEPVTLDVRIVAATHRDLRRQIAEGEFREDLFYRLAVVEAPLPPLRERGPDLRELALHFAGTFASRYGRPIEAMTEKALERLEAHDWPGNVRELRNVMDRAVLLARGRAIRASDLRLGAVSPRRSPPPEPDGALGYPPTLSLEAVEADHIRRVLDHTDGHMGRAADLLGIHRNTLTRKVRDYGLDGPEER